MKKILALLIVLKLIVSLAACGNSGKGDVKETSAAEATQKVEETAAEIETEAPATEQPDDDTVIAEQMAKLIGSWTYPGMDDYERLTFNDDGTGTYKGINDKDLSFNYTVSVDHKEYGNGEKYINTMLKMDYSTGETEDIIFWFNSDTEMAFHNSEDGGYSGVLNFAEYTRA